jgi:hypothetical protein
MIYAPMTYIKEQKRASSFVMAMFERGAVSFNLSSTATLADVAQRVADVENLRLGAPVAINVTLNPASKNYPMRAATHLASAEVRW